jgi:hypothetical protein
VTDKLITDIIPIICMGFIGIKSSTENKRPPIKTDRAVKLSGNNKSPNTECIKTEAPNI